MNNKAYFVIDADISRSSGTSEHPVSSSSRLLLENIKDNDCGAAFCKQLLSEWRNHRSIFAHKWLASMFAKRRIEIINPTKKLTAIINKHISSEKDQSAAHKDSHLVEIALIKDKIVISNDNKARVIFCSLSEKHKILNTIAWFNALNDRDFLAGFIHGGGLIPAIYLLTTKHR